MNIFLQIKDNYGTQKEAAMALGVSTSSFSEWVKGKTKPSALRTKQIERLTGIPREEIRPDIFGK